MCGIAGFYTSNTLPTDAETRVRDMLGQIRYRGPDQFGIYLGRNAAIGNARLSIIDLGGGQQPIGTYDQRYWIVYNGEVFNFIELRSELEAKGYQFATHTDTEVLLNLYQDQGEQCLHRLNGQFALAIYDTHENSLFLARDRLGVRPLYYWRKDGFCFFGSEIKCLLAGSRERASLNPSALGQVFTFWGALPGQSVFQGIQELRQGHWLKLKQDTVEIQRYWYPSFDKDMSLNGGNPAKPIEEVTEELKQHLIAATQIRLRADVPVGAYLSGGLDSSLIAEIIRSHTTNRLRTFSIAFTDERYDERDYQLRMAQFLGTEHEVVEATHADIGEIFPEVIRHTESPLLRTAPAPMFLLSKRVHECGYKVVLTGEGADEFFAGYDIFKEMKVRRFWSRSPDSKWRFRLLQKLYPDVFREGQTSFDFLKAFFATGLKETNSSDYSHAIRWRNTRRLWRFMTKEVLAECGSKSFDEQISPYLPTSYKQWGPLQQAQFLEITFFLSQYLLSSQGDRVAMANSVEGRYPFLDIRLIEWANQLPPQMKLHGLEEKFILRKIGKEWLPPEIWQRVKRPYRAPISLSFFHKSTPAYVRELLSEEAVRRVGIFNPMAVTQLANKASSGVALGETDDMALAGILSTQLLHHWFIEKFPSASPVGAGDDVKICKQSYN